MDYTTVPIILAELYRLVGTEQDDPDFEPDTAYLYLTRGCRKAQRWMLKQGYGGWRKRSAALTWSGADDTNGGRYVALPADFLRAYGNSSQSALTEADGSRWGTQFTDSDDVRGNAYSFRGGFLWIGSGATPPTTVYLDYHYIHPAWSASLADADIDFPLEARPLIVAEAANDAKELNFLPGGSEMETKIERALARARSEAGDISRQTKAPRTMRRPMRASKHW